MSSCKEGVIIYVRTIRNNFRKHEATSNGRDSIILYNIIGIGAQKS